MQKRKRKNDEISAIIRPDGVGAVRVNLSLDERFTKRSLPNGNYEWVPTAIEIARLEFEAEQKAVQSAERVARREEVEVQCEPRITLQNAPQSVVNAALHRAHKL